MSRDPGRELLSHAIWKQKDSSSYDLRDERGFDGLPY